MLKRLLIVAATTIFLLPCAMAFAGWGPSKASMSMLEMVMIVNSKKQECLKTVDVLSLDSIWLSLIWQEETIIFALI